MAKVTPDSPRPLPSEVTPGPVLTRKLLEGTLPWRVEVRVYNDQGDLVLSWDPRCRITHWEQKAHIDFGPTDIYFER